MYIVPWPAVVVRGFVCKILPRTDEPLASYPLIPIGFLHSSWEEPGYKAIVVALRSFQGHSKILSRSCEPHGCEIKSGSMWPGNEARLVVH